MVRYEAYQSARPREERVSLFAVPETLIPPSPDEFKSASRNRTCHPVGSAGNRGHRRPLGSPEQVRRTGTGACGMLMLCTHDGGSPPRCPSRSHPPHQRPGPAAADAPTSRRPATAGDVHSTPSTARTVPAGHAPAPRSAPGVKSRSRHDGTRPCGQGIASRQHPIRTDLFTSRHVTFNNRGAVEHQLPRCLLRLGRRGRTKASSAPTAARIWAGPRRNRSPAHHQDSCPSASRGCMPRPCSAHRGHACHRRSVAVSCAASATIAQRRDRVVRRVRIQAIAVPLTVGQSDVGALRLVRIVGRKGRQLQGFLLGKGNRHRSRSRRARARSHMGYSPGETQRGSGRSKRAPMSTILRHAATAPIAHHVVRACRRTAYV